MHISWARLTSFCHLGFISDPLIVSKFHNETHDPKGQENKIYTIVKGRETFYRRSTLEFNCNLENQIPKFINNRHLVFQFVPMILSLSILSILGLTNRTPLEISLRTFMGSPGLFQHSYIFPIHNLSLILFALILSHSWILLRYRRMRYGCSDVSHFSSP